MFETWFPLQSVLMSTLECLYHDTCLSQIEQLINSTVSPSNLTRLKSFSLLHIDTSANNLFIQSWTKQSSFDTYFNQCRSLTCQYTIYSRLNVIYIVTKILRLIDGIHVVLHLFLPLLIQFIFQIFNIIHQVTRENFFNYFHTLIRSSKQKLVEFNLFPTIPPSQDPKILERGRRTTRVYLILLIIALIILTLYAIIRQKTNVVIVESPSVSKYQELYAQYPLTLKCPCSHTVIKYNKIISQIEPHYHQICSSVFITSEWLDSLAVEMSFGTMHLDVQDYRTLIRVQFQALAQLCSLTQTTINTSLLIFG